MLLSHSKNPASGLWQRQRQRRRRRGPFAAPPARSLANKCLLLGWPTADLPSQIHPSILIPAWCSPGLAVLHRGGRAPVPMKIISAQVQSSLLPYTLTLHQTLLSSPEAQLISETTVIINLPSKRNHPLLLIRTLLSRTQDTHPPSVPPISSPPSLSPGHINNRCNQHSWHKQHIPPFLEVRASPSIRLQRCFLL